MIQFPEGYSWIKPQEPEKEARGTEDDQKNQNYTDRSSIEISQNT